MSTPWIRWFLSTSPLRLCPKVSVVHLKPFLDSFCLVARCVIVRIGATVVRETRLYERVSIFFSGNTCWRNIHSDGSRTMPHSQLIQLLQDWVLMFTNLLLVLSLDLSSTMQPPMQPNCHVFKGIFLCQIAVLRNRLVWQVHLYFTVSPIGCTCGFSPC